VLITPIPALSLTADALTQLQGLTSLRLQGLGQPSCRGLLQAASQLPQLLDLALPATARELEQLQECTGQAAQPATGLHGAARSPCSPMQAGGQLERRTPQDAGPDPSAGGAAQGEPSPQQPAGGACALPALCTLHVTLSPGDAGAACAPPSLPHLRSFSLTQAGSAGSRQGHLEFTTTTQHTRRCEGGSWASESRIALVDRCEGQGAGGRFCEMQRRLVQSGSAPAVTAAMVSVRLAPGSLSLQQLVDMLQEVAPGLQRLELDPRCRLASEPEHGLPVGAWGCRTAWLAPLAAQFWLRPCL
jgi:hypothetical protein